MLISMQKTLWQQSSTVVCFSFHFVSVACCFFFFSSSHAICNAFFPFWITSRKDMNIVVYEYELCAQAKQLALRQLKHIYCYPLRFAPLQMFEKYSWNSGHICSSMIYRRSLYYVKIKIWEKHTHEHTHSRNVMSNNSKKMDLSLPGKIAEIL